MECDVHARGQILVLLLVDFVRGDLSEYFLLTDQLYLVDHDVFDQGEDAQVQWFEKLHTHRVVRVLLHWLHAAVLRLAR